MNINNNLRNTSSTVMKGLLAPIGQDVPYQKFFAGITAYGDEGDSRLYLPTIEKIHTPSNVRQQWGGGTDSVNFSNGQREFVNYTIQSRFSYTDIDERRFEKQVDGVSLMEFLSELAQMGIRQRDHYLAMFGMRTGEGLVGGATDVTLPADKAGQTTLTAYNKNELFGFINARLAEILTNTYSMAKPSLIVSSSRVINYLKSAINQLTDYQVNAGVDSIAGAISRVSSFMLNGNAIEFVCDDLLKGSGAGGQDQILIIAPGLSDEDLVDEKYSQFRLSNIPNSAMNTFKNEWAGGIVETTNPIINRTTSKDFSLQTTAGIVLRSETVVCIDVKYQ